MASKWFGELASETHSYTAQGSKQISIGGAHILYEMIFIYAYCKYRKRLEISVT
jgi:hypothetical protein